MKANPARPQQILYSIPIIWCLLYKTFPIGHRLLIRLFVGRYALGHVPSTLPETNSSHLKMDGWNTSFLLGWPTFRGELLVSGSALAFWINHLWWVCLVLHSWCFRQLSVYSGWTRHLVATAQKLRVCSVPNALKEEITTDLSNNCVTFFKILLFLSPILKLGSISSPKSMIDNPLNMIIYIYIYIHPLSSIYYYNWVVFQYPANDQGFWSNLWASGSITRL